MLHGNVFAHYFSLGALRRKYPGCYRTIWHIHNNLNVVRHFGIPARFNWRQARRGADWLLCVSRASAAGWAPSGVATEVVHNCVSPQARVSRPASVASGPLRVVASGRMEWNKGLHVALEALARVLAAGVDMTLDVFGGPLEGNEYFAQLQAMTVELGITKAVQFHGFQSDFIKRLPSYDIALQCRIDPEPFGLYVLECMNIGVPVIASANGGILELLRADVDGLLYPPGDAAALANGLIELARNPARRQQLAENARVRAHEEFSQSIFARRLTQFYSRVGATLPAEDALKCLASASGSAPQKSICYESAI
ncbi:MAG: glycosyltransferase family 4 protein [Chthoniobacter sp.]|uniref:glycosyltransferase family 4 protein n=1 Tax=Chthoniobacter sp. TaxID=2510640 RepID=UPI0032A21AEA